MPISLKKILLAITSAMLMLILRDGCATTYLLNIHTTAKDRQFLISKQQKIGIVLPYPASENNASVIVALVLQPISDLTQVAFETEAALYLAYAPVGVFDTIKMAQQTRVAYGLAYSFDGARINGEGNGVPGYVSTYFDAPAALAQPLIIGLASYIYGAATGRPGHPSALNYYALNRHETRLIPQAQPVAWIFIGTSLSTGCVLPLSILKPAPWSVPGPVPAVAGSFALSGQQSPILQISRYLQVQLDASEQASIYFDSDGNAFSDAAMTQK